MSIYENIELLPEDLRGWNGDDWRHFADVERAVTRFCNERNITFDVVDDNFWIIKK